ncbi:hypothetical protein ACFZBM_11705 [Streptomyces lavendulae]|uniref:Mycothione reductase n=1 Tax=Streptomyces lavendulae subsp. lavendulae TaxID=58340 RepID=A0A2K8PNV5_STRLA|nr:hypothetical protein [Streptomyces lavendulae]ATZ28148.1 Mycothione reductase [Streptomyces lavendulae subsp. lavendulae]QUQ57976.1 Soluble pyridine nucleotide transhydrogenase [Streptomyces lavendulae subsp. lavendulae]
MRHHDLVVIGAGSGNADVDDSFADLDVAIVEERWFGGTCLNAGCIPSKMLAHTAHIARTVREAGAYDVDAWALEDTTGFRKVLAEPGTGRILGAHLMGAQAPTLIQPLVLAATLGIDAVTLARSPYRIHPALTEVVENTLLDLGL